LPFPRSASLVSSGSIGEFSASAAAVGWPTNAPGALHHRGITARTWYGSSKVPPSAQRLAERGARLPLAAALTSASHDSSMSEVWWVRVATIARLTCKTSHGLATSQEAVPRATLRTDRRVPIPLDGVIDGPILAISFEARRINRFRRAGGLGGRTGRMVLPRGRRR